jgi:hypothetical protein
MSPRRPAGGEPDVLAATDQWFLRHGLPYFVPEQRREARSAVRLGRTVPLMLLTGLVAVAAGVLLGMLAQQLALGTATLVTVGLLAATWYALTAMRARPIVRWALHRTFGSLRTLLPMMSRALPLLLLFVTFLFINAEVWEVSADLDGGLLWLVALLFVNLAVGFLLVRLPEEVDRVDDDVDDALLRRACRGTPLEPGCERLLAEGADVRAHVEVTGFERWNLVAVLLIIQAAQVLLLAGTVFVFFMVFGSMVMNPGIVENWTGETVRVMPFLQNITTELVQVSVFLAAFSSLYLTVSTVTDETYRAQFFGSVLAELERAVGMRAVYLALRAEPEPEPDPRD